MRHSAMSLGAAAAEGHSKRGAFGRRLASVSRLIVFLARFFSPHLARRLFRQIQMRVRFEVFRFLASKSALCSPKLSLNATVSAGQERNDLRLDKNQSSSENQIRTPLFAALFKLLRRFFAKSPSSLKLAYFRRSNFALRNAQIALNLRLEREQKSCL